MLLSQQTKGTFAEIKFWGNGNAWDKGDIILTRLLNAIKNLHTTGHGPILVDMGRVESIDNDSAKQLADFVGSNPKIKVAFYNIQRFAKHSLERNGMKKDLLFERRETALASFS